MTTNKTALTLLEEVRSHLDITWEDSAGDEKLLGIISRGIKYIERAAGATLDFIAEDKPRELLLEYSRYVRAGALEEFQTAFLPELLTLQIGEEVKAYVEKEKNKTNF